MHNFEPEGALEFYALVIRNGKSAALEHFYHAFKVKAAAMAS